MTDIIIGGGTKELHPAQGIVVQTRSGRNIPNVQDRKLSADRIAQSAKVRATFVRGSAVFVNGASGYYNCMGLVFASRRTQIDDTNVIWTVLKDDDYVEYPEGEAKIGDIAVYVKDASCDHVGIVVGEADPPRQATPRVLSKCGPSIEIVHDAHDGPYYDCDRRYFRVRTYDVPEPLREDDDALKAALRISKEALEKAAVAERRVKEARAKAEEAWSNAIEAQAKAREAQKLAEKIQRAREEAEEKGNAAQSE